MKTPVDRSFQPVSRTLMEQAQSVSLEEIFSAVQSTWKKMAKEQETKHLTMWLALFSGAVIGRVALQFVPSVEPIIPFAVLAGFLWGAREGFALGGGAYVASNFFVWGLQGPWTVFQAAGAAMAGGLAGILGPRTKPKASDLVFWSLIGTIVFEISVDIGGSLMGIGLLTGLIGLPLYFLTSLPFSLIHISSNLVFARMLAPLLKWRESKNELEVLAYSRRDGSTGTTTDIRLYRKRTG